MDRSRQLTAVLLLLILVRCGGAPPPAPAPAPAPVVPAGPAEYEILENRGVEAEQNSRLKSAFDSYMKAMAALPEPPPADVERRITERIIKLVPRLDPPPEMPEAAERLATRAQIMFSEAKNRGGFEEAAEEYRKALRIAPWSPLLLYNYALVLEKLEQYEDAIANMRLYLLTAPSDANEARVKIYELEYRAERPSAGQDTIHPAGARKFGRYLPPASVGKGVAAAVTEAVGRNRGIISNYSDMSIGSPVIYAAVAPGIRLSQFRIAVDKVRDFTRVKDAETVALLEQQLRQRIGAVTSRGTLGQLDARAALVNFTDVGGKEPQMVELEMVFRDPGGKTIAKLRHMARGNTPAKAVEKLAADIAAFIEDHAVVKY